MTRHLRQATVFTALFAALIITLSTNSHPVAADPVIGKPAPDFVGIDTKGKEIRLSALKGKTVVLEWTNDGCPYVRKHYGAGNMQALQKAAAEKDIVWLSVISSAPGRQGHVSPEKADELTVSRKASPTAIILDEKGTIGRSYEATATPHMYVVNPEGVLVYKGAIDDRPTANPEDIKGAKNYVTMALAALENGKKPDPGATRAYGCSIKYMTN